MASERFPKPSDPPDWHRLRLWHIQPVRDLLILALIFGLFYLGYVLRSITVPMLLALLFAYLFEPLIKRLTRSRYISRAGAALGIIASFFLLVVVPLGIGLSIGAIQGARFVERVATNTTSLVSLVQQSDPEKRTQIIAELPQGWQPLAERLNESRDYILEARPLRRDAEEAAPDLPRTDPDARDDADAAADPDEPRGDPDTTRPGDADPDGADADPPTATSPADDPPGLDELERDVYTTAYTIIDWIRGNADSLAKSLGQAAIVTGQGAIATAFAFFAAVAFFGFGIFLTAFFFFFFSTGWGRVLDFWAGFIPERKKGVAFDLITKMDRVIAGFVRGRLTICVIMGVVHTIAYWLIGVPIPFVIGPIAGLLYIVPFLHILTIPAGILLLWLDPSSISWQNTWWWIIFAPIGVDVGGQFLDDWILSPTIQGKTTEMDAPTILFASMAGGALAGMYGLLVAIPVAACIRILFKELFWPRFQRWARGQERDFLPISSAEESARAQPSRPPSPRPRD